MVSSITRTKPLRILYAAGPGDVIGTYNYWIKGQDDPAQVSVTYSSQFYDVCSALDAEGYVISSFSKKELVSDGRFLIEHRPVPWRGASGLLYHFSHIWYGFRLVASAIRFKANVAVVANGATYWFVLFLLSLLKIKVIPTLHCVLWRKYTPQSTLEKLILRLNGNFFASRCTVILAVSEDISEQMIQLTADRHQPLVKFLPTYRRTEFVGVAEPDNKRSPFRVLFAGRIERDKGVFDLLEIAKYFAARGRQDITFDLCGAGSALQSLRQAAKQAKVDSSFICYGHCDKPQMREMFNRAHVVIVPTRTDFVEGFNKVVVEGVLSSRPVVTSAVCPSLSYVEDAIVKVPPDEIKGYCDALLKLCDEREFYEEKRRNCLALQEQFYDNSRSWGAALKSVLVTL